MHSTVVIMMKSWGLILFAIWLIWPCSAQVRADATTQLSEEQLNSKLRKLGDADPGIADDAEILVMAQPLALPSYESALKSDSLPAAAKARLQHCVELLRPGYAARCRQQAVMERTRAWEKTVGVEAYLTVGVHDPKWDDAAKDAIRYGLKKLDDSDMDSPAVAKKLDALCMKATYAGCTDPLVLTLKADAESVLDRSNSTNALAALRAGANAILTSNYSPFLRSDTAETSVWLCFNVEQSVAQSDRDIAKAGLALMMQSLSDKDIPPPLIGQLTGYYLDLYGGGLGHEKETFESIYPTLEKALPGDPTPLDIKGSFYIDAAWAAVGNRPSRSGKGLAQEKLEVNLKLAASALNEAYQMNPDDPRAATEMMTVEMGLRASEAEMNQWFDRAMKADPENDEACRTKMNYLSPQWFGNAEKMIAFARECFAGENWSCRIPLELADARLQLAEVSGNADQYFESPDVWNDLNKAFCGFLVANPDDDLRRSKYALYACKCGQWQTAKEQFDIMGDRAVISVFDSRDGFEAYRDQANAQSGDPSTTDTTKP